MTPQRGLLPRFIVLLCAPGFIAASLYLHGIPTTLQALVVLSGFGLLFVSCRTFGLGPGPALVGIFAPLCFISFLPPPWTAAAAGVLLTAALTGLILRPRRCHDTFVADLQTARSALSAPTLLMWGALLFLVTMIGMPTPEGYVSLDSFHPLYELSVGRSYAEGLIDPPDLAYAGKTMKFHFLSTGLPLLFHHTLGTDLLEATYFLTPLLLLLGIIVAVEVFIRRFTNGTLPRLILLFFPISTWLIYTGYGPTIENDFRIESMYNRLYGFSPSFTLAQIWMMLALVFLLERRLRLFFLCAWLLLVTKASFFLVLGGGVLLYRLFQRDRRALVRDGLCFAALFLPTHHLWLSGAHAHNHWMLVPHVVDYALHWGSLYKIDAKLFVNLGSYALYYGAFAIACFKLLKPRTADEPAFLSAALSLSALAGTALLSEASEHNTIQFLFAAHAAMAVVLWTTLKGWLESNRIVVHLGSCLFVWMLTGTMAYKLTAPYWRNGLAQLEAPRPTPEDERVRPARPVRAAELISRDAIDAYTWLHDHPAAEGVVLIGKHYEAFQKRQWWWVSTGFFRSALSGCPFYAEEDDYRGLIMEPDFPQRLASVMFFYERFVEKTPESALLLSTFRSVASRTPAERSFKEGHDRFGMWPYRLGFGKEWSMINRAPMVLFEAWKIYADLERDPDPEGWAARFLKESNISTLILEYSDRPGPWLSGISEEVYANGTIRILRLR